MRSKVAEAALPSPADVARRQEATESYHLSVLGRLKKFPAYIDRMAVLDTIRTEDLILYLKRCRGVEQI